MKKRSNKTTRVSNPNRRYSYSFLTMGGRRFVQLTPERFSRLYEKEQQAIIRTAKYTKEDIRTLTKQDYVSILNNMPEEMRGSPYRRLVDIATGKVQAEVEDITITNYGLGLKDAGRLDLQLRFEQMARYLKQTNPKEFEIFMKELPDLFLFYKDKGRSHVQRQSTFNQMVADDQLSVLNEILSLYEYENPEVYGIDTDEYEIDTPEYMDALNKAMDDYLEGNLTKEEFEEVKKAIKERDARNN